MSEIMTVNEQYALPTLPVFDSHAHYFDKKFEMPEGGADALLSSEEFRTAVCGVINVGTRPENCLSAIEQAQRYDFMYAAVGIHPEDCRHLDGRTEDELDKIYAFISDVETRRKNKIVAIGEIGYDYYWQPADKKKQTEYFAYQMEMANKIDLPVIIHDREAHGDTFDMILRYPEVRGVMHSCSLSAEMAKDLARRGWFISFSGTLTFKNAVKVREACAAVPRDKLLVETDAPYLAPHPHRGKMNNSLLMRHTVTTLAEVHGMTPDEAATLTANNAKALFGLE